MKRGKKKPGRPKGLPKTGGRKLGTPNKSNVRMRDRFAEAGFDYVQQVIVALGDPDLTADHRLDFLSKMAPYFMQRLREESEETPTPSLPQTPADLPEQDLTQIPTEHLLQLLAKTPGPGGGN